MKEEFAHLHALFLPFAMADYSSVVGARNGAYDRRAVSHGKGQE